MILFIGPCENIKDKNKTGGIVVLFEDLLDWSSKNKINHKVIDTTKANYNGKISALFSIYFSILKKINKSEHVSLHGTAKDYLFIAPYVVLLSIIFKKKVHLRKFAGNFDCIYYKSNFIKKRIYSFVLKRADLLFFETKNLVLFGKDFNKKTYWLPNTRVKPTFVSSNSFKKKFIFISQVKNTKGIVEILKAKEILTSDYEIDIFGPLLKDELDITGVESIFKKAYKGVLSHADVQAKLQAYDVVLLPTYHEGEGYPGIILESFSLGIPVISTQWNSIEELVQDNFNGFLVPIKDYKALANAILKFDEGNYKKMSANALKSFNQFDRNANYEKYIDLICST